MARHPLTDAREEWERVLEDAAATAAEYREAGWETLELHPGDVRPLPPARSLASATDADADADDRVGFDVTVPGDEFERLAEWTADAAFDEYEAYTARRGEVVFVVVVARDEVAGRAVFVPLYYALPQAETLVERATEAGEVGTTVRPLSDERRVTLTQAEPSPLFPTVNGNGPGGGEGGSDGEDERDEGTDAPPG